MFELSLIFLLSIIIILCYNYLQKVFNFLRIIYFFTKLPGPSFLLVGQTLIRAIHVKDNELFPMSIELMGVVKTKTTSALLCNSLYTVVLHPSELERFLSSTVNITKGSQYRTAELWLREGLLTSKGEKWHRRRKILTPTFHFKILQDSVEVINNNANILCDKLLQTGGKAFKYEDYVYLCTLDIICETAMGIKLDFQRDNVLEYVEDIKRVCQIIVTREIRLVLGFDLIFNCTPMYKELKQIIARLHAFTDKVIANRKEAFIKAKELGEIDKDKKRPMAFLDCLIDAELKEPGTFSDTDMREEVDTFMFEGHDTTATAVIFCLLILSKEKEIQENVIKELDEIFGKNNRPATMEDLHEMKYLEKVIKETLRLFPVVPFFSRLLDKDFILEDGRVVPKGTNVSVITYVLHRNEAYYPNPEKFDPERFSEENIRTRRPFSYIPFSAGPRNCIGQKFAMIELKIIISTVLRRYNLEFVTNWEELKLVPRIVMKPEKPVEIKFCSRT